jgi:hypothetical protein
MSARDLAMGVWMDRLTLHTGGMDRIGSFHPRPDVGFDT